METNESYVRRWQHYKEILVDIIIKYLPGAKIYLYGSRARGDFREGSDVDLAIDAGKKIDHNIMLKIYGDIEETTLPTLFDGVDVYSISPEMLADIKKRLGVMELTNKNLERNHENTFREFCY